MGNTKRNTKSFLSELDSKGILFEEYVFSSNQFTWVMKLESLIMKDFFKFENKDLII